MEALISAAQSLDSFVTSVHPPLLTDTSICVWLHLIEVAINIYEWELMLFKDVVSCLLTKVLC